MKINQLRISNLRSTTKYALHPIKIIQTLQNVDALNGKRQVDMLLILVRVGLSFTFSEKRLMP